MKSFIMFFLFLLPAYSLAADIGGITVNGEATFDYNILSSANKATIPFTGSAKNETYRLNAAQILLKKETDELSFLARLLYQPTGFSADGGTDVTTSDFGFLEQLEFFYKATPQLQVGFGRFLTTMGYESALKSENATYNTSIAYNAIVPGYGEGLRVKYQPTEQLTATISSYNRAEYSLYGDDNNATKTTEVSLGGAYGDWSWFGGYYFGADTDAATKTSTIERTATSVWTSYKLLENLNLALTYDAATSNTDNAGVKWYDSTTAQANYTLGRNTLTLRYELVRGAMNLSEAGSTVYGSADTVNSVTLAEKFALNENLNLYAEYRMDQADKEVFVDSDGASTKNASMFTLAAIAHF